MDTKDLRDSNELINISELNYQTEGYSEDKKIIKRLNKAKQVSNKLEMTANKISLEKMLCLFDIFCMERKDEITSYIDKGEYSKFDPVLSEWGCQLRAFHITDIINDALKNQHFSDELIHFLAMALFLTESSKLALRLIKNDGDFKNYNLMSTDESQLPQIFLNFLAKNNISSIISKTMICHIYSSVKRMYAEKQLNSLFNTMNLHKKEITLSSDIVNDLTLILKSPYHISFSNESVPCISVFDTAVLSTELISLKKLDIIINVKRFIKHKDEIYEEGQTNLYYKGNNSKFVFQKEPSIESKTSPVAYFEMYSASIKDELHGNSNLFYKKDTFVEFIKTLIEEVDVKEMLLQYLAVHPQFTQALPLKKFEESSSDLKYHYIKYKKLGEINKIGEIHNHNKSPHFSKDIPLNLVHARISSFKEAEELLLRRCKVEKDIFSK